MTTTPQPKPEPTLQDVLDRLTILGAELDEVKRTQDKMQRKQGEMQRSQEQGQQWQDRTWDVVKWVGGISAGLAVSASITLVGIVLRQLVQWFWVGGFGLLGVP